MLYALLELIKSLHPLRDEFLVVDAFFDDHVEHAQRQSAVGARPYLQVMHCAASGPCVSWIHRNDLRATPHAIDNPVSIESIGTPACRILAPSDYDLGRHPLRIVVTLFEKLRAVDDGEVAHDCFHRP